MKLLEDAVITLERDDLKRYPIYKGGGVEERPSGIHVSGIYRELAIRQKLFKAIEELDSESIPTRWIGGMAWEEFILSLYPDVTWQPGAVEVDDIWMTCDGLTSGTKWSPHHYIIEECKSTHKKVQTGSTFIDVVENWLYLVQGRAYAKGYDALIVRWHVYYVNGDYRGSGPIYKRFVVEFAAAEVESNWRMLLNHKHLATPEG